MVEEAVMDSAEPRREEEKSILTREATDVLLKCQKRGNCTEMSVKAPGKSQTIQD